MILQTGLTVFESGHKKPEKRKKVKGGDAGEIDNFLGPWAKYLDEKLVAKPTEVKALWIIWGKYVGGNSKVAWKPIFFLYLVIFIIQEEQKELNDIIAKRQKRGRNEEEAPAEEKTILHGTW